MPTLSIIIPIFNTPTDVLNRCFSSLNTLEGIPWEAVLIDDGSQHEVGAFCQAYQSKDSRFRYFFKENGGVSSARNLGIEKALGTYIMFVDADDMLLGQPIVQYLHNCQADMTVFDMQLQENSSECTWHSLPCDPGVIDRLTFLKHLLTGKSLNSPCVKLFRRDLIQSSSLHFLSDYITGEDWLFVTDYSLHSQSFAYVRQSCYRYFRDEATGSSRLSRFPDVMLRNGIGLYEKKIETIGILPFQEAERYEMRRAAGIILTEDMFNSAAELLLLKQLTPERKHLITDCVRSAKASAGKMPLKTRLKAFTLLRFPAGLWLLAKLRQFYLKHK